MTNIEAYNRDTAYGSKDNIERPDPYKIVCLGDSITNTTAGSRRTYPDWLQILLGRGFQLIVKGIQGERTDQMLTRFAADVTAQSPRECIVQAGINDCNQSIAVATITANLTLLYDGCRNVGITPKAVLLLPCGNLAGWNGTKETARQDVNFFIREEGVEFIDPDDLMADFTVPTAPVLKAAYDLGDGIHPSSAGATKLAEIVFTGLYDRGALGERALGTI